MNLSKRIVKFITFNLLIYSLSISITGPERLSRGLVAFPRENGQIYLGWRLLRQDIATVGFNVYRSTNSGGPYSGPLNSTPIIASTNYLDAAAQSGMTYYYIVVSTNNDTSNQATMTSQSSGQAWKFISKVDGGRIVRVIFGDVTGDGLLDMIMLDDYQGSFYLQVYNGSNWQRIWKKYLSTPPADKAGGSGNEYWGPFTVWDFDGNGKCEIYAFSGNGSGDFYSAEDFLVALDGETGTELGRTAWLRRDDISDYDTNFLGIGIWDSIPHLVAARGIQYDGNRVAAYTPDPVQEWEWTGWNGSGGHTMAIFDFNGDRNDEILWGSLFLNGTGSNSQRIRWERPNNHCDINEFGDFDPNRPGLEAWFGDCLAWCRGLAKQTVALVDCQNGNNIMEKEWDDQRNRPLGHIHNGYVADVDPAPGTELIGWDDYNRLPIGCGFPESQYPVTAAPPHFVVGITGNFLHYTTSNIAFRGVPVQFDDDDIYEMTTGWGNPINIFKLNGPTLLTVSNTQQFNGTEFGPQDIFGDFREECIAKAPDNSGVYIISNSTVSGRRKVTWLEDQAYRQGMALLGSGYIHTTSPKGYYFDGTSTGQDVVPPQILETKTKTQTQVEVIFSENVDKTSAENLSHYSIDGGIGNPSSAVLTGGRIVALTVPSLTSNQNYILTVNNVTDLSGNKIAANSQRTFSFIPVCISNLWVASGKTYQAAVLGSGDEMYIDRAYVLGNLPTAYQGLAWVKTAMDDKTATDNPFLTYSISTNTTVYIGFSTKASIPPWAPSEGWVENGDSLYIYIVNQDIPYALWEKSYAANSTVSMGGKQDLANQHMYVVLNRTACESPTDLSKNNRTGNPITFIVSPNPLSSPSEIEFSIPLNMLGKKIVLSILNLQGKEIRTLFRGTLKNRSHSVSWNGLDAWQRSIPGGIYFIQLNSPTSSLTKKVVVLK